MHSVTIFLFLFQLSPDPTYAEVKKPQSLSLQYDEVPPPVPPYSADNDQPPPIPLFHFEDEPSLSLSEPVIAQYSVIMREHIAPHVPPCSTVAEGDDSTQSVSKREEIKVIKQLSSLNL